MHYAKWILKCIKLQTFRNVMKTIYNDKLFPPKLIDYKIKCKSNFRLHPENTR